MEILLALAGLAGFALLFQGKPLPSEAEYNKAQEVLVTDPTDPSASTIVGKYLAFVMGDYKAGMPHLANSSDKTLQSLAEHEADPAFMQSPAKKIDLANEWVAAGKKFPALSRPMYDRATQWYISAWPDLNDVWREKMRLQGRKLAASRPPGPARKGLPGGWNDDLDQSGRSPVLDGNVAHTGSYSLRLLPPDEKVRGSFSKIKSDVFPVTGKSVDISGYVLADGTETTADRLVLLFWDRDGVPLETTSLPIPADLPFWNRLALTMPIPAKAATAQFGVVLGSRKGGLWVDDVSVRFDDRESVKNPSFEGK